MDTESIVYLRPTNLFSLEHFVFEWGIGSPQMILFLLVVRPFFGGNLNKISDVFHLHYFTTNVHVATENYVYPEDIFDRANVTLTINMRQNRILD